MSELIFGPITVWFTVPALIGTAFFALRTGLMLVGGDADTAGEVDVDLGDADPGDSGDSSEAFRILSLQAISAFLMGFGWGGLGSFLGSGWSLPASVGVGLLAGVAMMWVLARALRFVYGLQSSGNLPLYRALEAKGSVYAQIPAAGGGKGEVRVVVGDRERYYRAISDGRALPTGARIRVVEVNEDDDSVTVTEA